MVKTMEIKINRVELIKKKGELTPSSIEKLNENCNITVNKDSVARNILSIKKIQNGGKNND